jgi:WD40 repeat protein
VATLEGHRSYVNKVVFAPDGLTLYSASADQSIRIWDLAQKKQVGRLQGHVGPVTGLAFCPRNGTLVSCAADKSVRVWDPRRPPMHRSQGTIAGIGFVYGTAFMADSRRLITACMTNSVTIWDVATADPITRIPSLGTSNLSLALSLDERWVAVGSADGKLKVANLRTQRLVKEWQPHRFRVGTVWFVRGGTALFSCGWIAHQQFEPKLWDASSWQELPCAVPGAKLVYGVALSRDHRLLAVAYGNEPVRIWDTVSGRVDVLPGSEWAFGLGFSSDNRLLAAGFGSWVRIWDVRSRRELASVEQPLSVLASATFSPDGKRLVTGLATSGDMQPALRVCDFEAGRDLLSLHGHGAWTQWIEFSPDGNALLAVSYFGVADLWRAPSWAEIEQAEKSRRTP